MSVLDAPIALDNDIGVGLKQAENLLTGRYAFTLKYTALRLINYLLDLGQIMRHLGMPSLQLQCRAPRDAQHHLRLFKIPQRIHRYFN